MLLVWWFWLLSVIIGVVELLVLNLISACVNCCLVLLHGHGVGTEAFVDCGVECSSESFASALDYLVSFAGFMVTCTPT